MMKRCGEVVYWNDEKGFGFIRYDEKEPNIFFHISSFAYHRCRPHKGDQVAFLRGEQRGKAQAVRVVLAKDADLLDGDVIVDAHDVRPHLTEAIIYAILIIAFYTILGLIAPTLAIASFIISLFTIALYAMDKRAATQGRFRVPEATLHIAAMLGGWPGALIARPVLRHKTRKTRFITFFWASVVIYFFLIYSLLLYLPEGMLRVEEGLNQLLLGW